MFSKIRNPYLRAFFKFLASIRLAVLVILGIGVISAYGTIVEARYDALTAQKLVYHAWWSYSIYGFLIINLIAVMVDRLPWKRGHVGFISAHIGIIILLMGSLLTRYYGLDGSIRIGIGESKSHVTLPDTELNLWASLDGTQYTSMLERPLPVDFLVRPPSEDRPFELLDGKIKIVGFIPYALRDVKVRESDRPADGPGVRFVLESERVKITDWLVLGSTQSDEVMDLGPAKLIFSQQERVAVEGNAILLRPGEGGVSYSVYTESRGGVVSSGFLRAGQSVETGWMDLTLRVLNYHERARYDVEYVPQSRPTPMSISTLKLRFKEQDYQVGLNAHLRLFDDDKMYVLGYGNRMVPLDFPIKLIDFRVGRYQGTMRAASYESLVEIPDDLEASPRDITQAEASGATPSGEHSGARPGHREVLIYMNEPLKYRGLTFYQASFEEDDMGEPSASILSVNYDPGRFWKYFGSLLLTFGVAHLFYMRAQKTPVAR